MVKDDKLFPIATAVVAGWAMSIPFMAGGTRLTARGGLDPQPGSSLASTQSPSTRPAPAAAGSSDQSGRLLRRLDLTKEDRHPDAWSVMAEYAGVDLGESALQDQARASARYLLARTPARPVPMLDKDSDVYVAAQLLAIAPGGSPLLAGYSTADYAALVWSTRTSLSAAAEAEGDAAAAAHEYLHEYFWGDHERLRIDTIKRALGSRQVGFVIATLPDPIDSNARWMFDPMVDALQRAVAESDYALAQFYLPDWNAPNGDHDHASEPNGAHERWPAVLLFRSGQGSSERLLVVFVVSETATAGIHQAALHKALAAIRGFTGPSPDPIRVLGPTFSGSISSLARTLQDFDAGAATPLRYRIVSGGATGSFNRDAMRDTLGARATYQATVLPDELVLEALCRQLLRMHGSASRIGRVALLHEDNTKWWESLQRGIIARVKASRNEPSATAVVLGDAIAVPFPMHISRLRAAGQREGQPAPAGAPQRFRALSLEEPNTAADQIPAFSPKLTASSVELVLANLLDTLKREQVTTIGLLATDTRDKLFLAQQIAHAVPNVTLFTLESDLLYLHPDYNRYVRGMLVGSTYPLLAANQSWTASEGSDHVRSQFPSTHTEGIYNATLALLNYDDTGAPLTVSRAGYYPPPLLDYRSPFRNDCDFSLCVPPAWTSVVGRDAIWPLAYTHFDDAPVVQPAAFSELMPGTTLHPSAAILFTVIGIMVISVVVSAGHWFGAGWPLARLFGSDPAAEPYKAIAFTALLAPYVLLVWLTIISMAVAWPTSAWWTQMLSIGVLISAALVLAGALHCLGRSVASWRRRRADAGSPPADGQSGAPPVHARIRTAAATLLDARTQIAIWGGVLALVATGSLVWYVASMVAAAPATEFVPFLERATHPESQVSPLGAVIFLAAAVFVWASCHLRRVHGPSLQSITTATWLDDLLPTTRRGDWRLSLKEILDSPTCGLPTRVVRALVIALAAGATFVLIQQPVTTEPFAFSLSFVTAWLLVQMLTALTLAQTVRLWMVVRTLLCGLHQSMGSAFARISSESIMRGMRLSPHPVRMADLWPAIRQRRALMLQIPAVAAAEAVAGASLPSSQGPVAHAPDNAREGFAAMKGTLEADIDLQAESEGIWSQSAAWKQLGESAAHVAHLRRESSSIAAGRPVSSREAPSKDGDVRQWLTRGDEFLAHHVSVVIRELTSRVASGLLASLMMVVLMICALSSLQVQPRQPLLAFSWIYVSAVAISTLGVFIAIDRDPVISRLSGTRPNHTTWDLAFVSKVLVYGAVPLLTLFAAQFPDIGGTLLHWIRPIQPLP